MSLFMMVMFVVVDLVSVSSAFPIPNELNEPESVAAICQERETATATASDETGPTCSGVVKTADGRLLSGATVYFLMRKGNTLPTHPLRATTDENGEYSFDDVPPGKYRIWAEGDGLTSAKKFLGGDRVDVTSEKKAIDIDDVTVTKACDYRVTVVSAETKQAIEGAKIHFGWTDIEREYTTETHGVSLIRGLASNDWYFVIKAEGYATYFEKTAPQTLGSTTDLKFELKPGADVEFDLRDQFEEPISGAIIEIQYKYLGMTPHLIPYPTKTDADGKLIAKGMPLNTKLRLIVSKDGYRFAGIGDFEVDGEDDLEKARFVGQKLPYGGDVELNVTDEDGEPIADASVKNPSSSSGRYRQSKTDAKGRASLKNLYTRSDKKYVVIKSEGKIPQRLEVEPGRKDEPTIVNVTMESGKSLMGVVLTPDGKPVAKNTRVYFNRGELGGAWAGGRVLTDANGKFSIDGLPDNTTLTVYTPQQYEPIRDLKVKLDKHGDVTIKVIKMTPGAVLRLRAVDDAGEPIPEFNVRLDFVDRKHRLEGDKSSGGISGSLMNPGVNVHGTQKVYRLDHQVAGATYKVIVSAKGYETETIQRMQTVVESESEVIDVTLSKTTK